MFCSNCGKTLKGDMSACPHCGAAIGESRFEGHPYTGAQMRTKPGEAVRLPGNHTKTTFMGKKPELDQDVDARTTYRATADQVYKYDEPEDVTEPEEALGADEEYAYDTPEYEEEAYAFDSPEEGEDDKTAFGEESVPEEYGAEDAGETEEIYDAEEAFDSNKAGEVEEEYGAEAEEYAEKADSDEDEEYGGIEDSDEDDEFDEPKPKKKQKKLSRRERRILEEDEMVDAELEELRVREIRIDNDDELEEGIRKYKESGRYDEIEDEPVVKKKAKSEKKAKKKLFSFGKRAREEDFDSLTPDEFEIVDDDSAFDLSDLPEDGEEAVIPYDASEEVYDEIDEEIERELEEELGDMEDIELDEADVAEVDEMIYNEKQRRVLDPEIKNILKYAIAAVLLVAIIVGAVIGLGNINEKSKEAPISEVTYDLYYEGLELMKYRASAEYRNSFMNGYDPSKLMAVSDKISGDLDAISDMLPENQLVNDQRYVAALSAIQNNINSAIVYDLLAVNDNTKSQAEKDAESAQRWQLISDTVNALADATSTVQLDAIVKGEKIEIIQQATPAPAATPTPVPYVVLSKGSEGAAVRELQNRLSELGYLKGTVDAIFGNQTKTAIQLFQKAVGLEVTGIADVQTQISLFSADAPRMK